MPRRVPGWLSRGRLYGAALSALSGGAFAQRRQDHAHVRQRGGERVPASALARNRRQAGLSRLWLHDLLCLPAIAGPIAMALQGVS